MKRAKRMRIMREAKAIIDSKTLVDAYMKSHPDSTLDSAKKNAWRMLKRPAVQEQLTKILENAKPVDITKDRLVVILGEVIARWYIGEEKTSDMIRTIELLSNLCPEFSSKQEIHQFKHMTEAELDAEIKKKYGNLLGRN